MNWTFELTSTSIWKKGSKIYFVFNYSNKSSFVNLADELFLWLRPKKTIHSDQHLENRKKREKAKKKSLVFTLNYVSFVFHVVSSFFCLFIFPLLIFFSLIPLNQLAFTFPSNIYFTFDYIFQQLRVIYQKENLTMLSRATKFWNFQEISDILFEFRIIY